METKIKKSLNTNLFDGNVKYIVAGRLNRPLAFASGWPVLTLKPKTSNGQVIFNNDDKSKSDVFNADVADMSLFHNASVSVKDGVTFIKAEYDTIQQATEVIKIFPSDTIILGILEVKSDGIRTSKTEIMSDISFVRGEFLCDPKYVKKYRYSYVEKAALDWKGREDVLKSMQKQGWQTAVINYDNETIIEYDPEKTEIVNPKLEEFYTDKAEKIFNKLSRQSAAKHFVAGEKEVDEKIKAGEKTKIHNTIGNNLMDFAFDKGSR